MLPERDPWAMLRTATRARVGLGRCGDSIPIRHVLALQAAEAVAHDAVRAALDTAAAAAALAPLPVVQVRSAAADRETYLRRPDLGRRLDPACLNGLVSGDDDVVFVVADGLSAAAVQCHAAPLIAATLRRLPGWRVAPVVIATQARVALGDEIGERLNARLAVVLIGERPGLSVAESMGAYLTYAPRVGRRDSERNCLSNIYEGGGLSCEAAADKLAWLMAEAVRRKLSGVDLKDEAPAGLPADAARPSIPADASTTSPLATGRMNWEPEGLHENGNG